MSILNALVGSQPTTKAEKESILERYMDGPRVHKYCSACGREFIYLGRTVYHDPITGEPSYSHIIGCPRKGSFEDLFHLVDHDRVGFSYTEQ